MIVGKRTLSCLSCGKPLFNVTDNVPNQPNNGVVCHTSGNYGSTQYDALGDHSFLEFNVCDDCLGDAGLTGRVVEVTRQPQYPLEDRQAWPN